jgi:hypothetical protein
MHKICIFVCLLFGCSVHELSQLEISHVSKRISAVPIEEVIKMDSSIAVRIGRELFRKYLVFDSSLSGVFRGDITRSRFPIDSSYLESDADKEPPYLGQAYYIFIYFFRIPEKPWQNIEFIWPRDLLKPADQFFPFGDLPECLSNPGNCNFVIDSMQAVSIAIASGISKGIRPITAKLDYLTREKRIVWNVQSLIMDDGRMSDLDFRMVCMSTGEILMQGHLMAQP